MIGLHFRKINHTEVCRRCGKTDIIRIISLSIEKLAWTRSALECMRRKGVITGHYHSRMPIRVCVGL